MRIIAAPHQFGKNQKINLRPIRSPREATLGPGPTSSISHSMTSSRAGALHQTASPRKSVTSINLNAAAPAPAEHKETAGV
jgi:hypothetical protein